MAPRCVLFDLNGTLLDPRALAAAWHGDGATAVAALDEALEIAQSLPPFDGARAMLERLAQMTQVAVLTNTATESAREALDAAGLAEPLSAVIGADQVGRYKPHPDVYAHALERLGLDGGEVMLAAAHWWDVHGAKRAGLRTCWIAHNEERLLSTVDAPDVTVASLEEIPAALEGVAA